MKRKTIWVSLCLMALCLLSPEDTAQAQTCHDQCQQVLSSCLQGAGGDPVSEAQCQRDYDKCATDCMLQSAARKGDKLKVKAATGGSVFREGQAWMKDEVEVGDTARGQSHSCRVESLLFPPGRGFYVDSQLKTGWFSPDPATVRLFMKTILDARPPLRR